MSDWTPPLDTLRLGFIGAGRFGTAMAWSFAQRGCKVVAVASRSEAAAQRLAAAIPGCRVTTPQGVADGCDLVFIATPDSAIADVASAVQWRAGIGVVHGSGATEVDALDKARRDGAMIGGFHPMQAFADPEAAMRSLPGCTVTIEAGEPLDALLVALAQRLECRVNRLPPGVRALYHAAGGHAAGHLNVLLHEGAKVWRLWGATEEDALRAFIPLARGTLASIEQKGLARGMPGPVSRGDVGSVAKHVAAFAPLDPEMLEFYRVMCTRSVDLALEAGAIDAKTAEAIRRVLDGAAR